MDSSPTLSISSSPEGVGVASDASGFTIIGSVASITGGAGGSDQRYEDERGE
jgi:hypothetical protein